MFNTVKNYCLGKLKINIKQEKEFLLSKSLQELTGIKRSLNSGKLAEWYIKEILKDKNVNFKSQPLIYYNSSQKGKKRYFCPDFYIPDKNLFIEVKSRSYNCGGTASEKADHIARKYSSKLKLTEKYKNSKVLVVFCAGELFQETTLELINDELSEYSKAFVEFTKKHSILDWIDINNLEEYI